MSTGNLKKRKRGVRASRLRLHEALAQAGFKTQSALAERIADLEGLDAPPKDLVNRVFGEYAVAPQTLERVARALGVPAYTLYLAGNEMARRPQDQPPVATPLPATPTETAPRSRLRRVTPWPLACGTIAGLALLGGVLLGLPHDTSLGCSVHEFVHPLHAAGRRLGIIVARFDQDPTGRAQHVLATGFLDDARIAPYVTVLQSCRGFSRDVSSNVAARRRALRARGRSMLGHADALVLLWGRIQGDRAEVRFVSTRPGDGREARLQVPVPLDAPAQALRAVKATTLQLMRPRNTAKAAIRRKLARVYASASAARPATGAARVSDVRHEIVP